MPVSWKRGSRWLLIAIVVGVLVWAFMPEPLPVEVASATRGPLRTTVDEEGKVRVHDSYVVAAPVGGRLMRISLREGDRVDVGQVVAQVAPVPLSVREREEQSAHVSALDSLQREAQERVRRAQADAEQAGRDRERAERLVREKLVSPQSAEQTRLTEITRRNDLAAARFRAASAASDTDAARAMLRVSADSPLVDVHAPVAGPVLKVSEQSERVITSGTPLLTIGDPSRYEVVLEVLSSEAVKVRPGMDMLIENWGGANQLHARVRVVEPQAFTKVSALGVEEQRVNVVADLVDAPPELGDGYRVEGRIVVWQAEDVLRLPQSCLFRSGTQWSAFVVMDGRAHLRLIEVGHRSSEDVEVLSGIQPGETLIRHPSNIIQDGARVAVIANIP